MLYIGLYLASKKDLFNLFLHRAPEQDRGERQRGAAGRPEKTAPTEGVGAGGVLRAFIFAL